MGLVIGMCRCNLLESVRDSKRERERDVQYGMVIWWQGLVSDQVAWIGSFCSLFGSGMDDILNGLIIIDHQLDVI